MFKKYSLLLLCSCILIQPLHAMESAGSNNLTVYHEIKKNSLIVGAAIAGTLAVQALWRRYIGKNPILQPIPQLEPAAPRFAPDRLRKQLEEKETAIDRLERQLAEQTRVHQERLATQLREQTREHQESDAVQEVRHLAVCQETYEYMAQVRGLGQELQQLKAEKATASLRNKRYLRTIYKLRKDREILESISEGPKPEGHFFARIGLINTSHDIIAPTIEARWVLPDAEPGQEKNIKLPLLRLPDHQHQQQDIFGSITPHAIEHEVPQGYNCTSRLVKESLKCHGTIALVCVHGTHSDGASFGGNLEKDTSQNILKFAQMLAVAQQCCVQVITFTWSGDLSLNVRERAGRQLAEIISKDNYKAIWTIAHSHGCNVVNWAAYQLFELLDKPPIDVAILIASPAPDYNHFKNPEDKKPSEVLYYFKKIYHFYSTGDGTQLLGSLYSEGSTERRLNTNRESECTIHNIRTQCKGEDANHIDIKYVIEHLPGLLHAIDTYYTCFFDLDAKSY